MSIKIKIAERIPITHHFIYRNKSFPINFDLFKFASKYFLYNKKVLKKTQYINLLDNNLEYAINLTDKTIQNFIDYVQRSK